MPARTQDTRRPANNLRRGIAGDRGERLVDAQDNRVGVGDHHAFLRLEGGGRDAQLLLGLLAVAYIQDHADDRRAALELHPAPVHLHLDPRTILAQAGEGIAHLRHFALGASANVLGDLFPVLRNDQVADRHPSNDFTGRVVAEDVGEALVRISETPALYQVDASQRLLDDTPQPVVVRDGRRRSDGIRRARPTPAVAEFPGNALEFADVGQCDAQHAFPRCRLHGLAIEVRVDHGAIGELERQLTRLRPAMRQCVAQETMPVLALVRNDERRQPTPDETLAPLAEQAGGDVVNRDDHAVRVHAQKARASLARAGHGALILPDALAKPLQQARLPVENALALDGLAQNPRLRHRHEAFRIGAQFAIHAMKLTLAHPLLQDRPMLADDHTRQSAVVHPRHRREVGIEIIEALSSARSKRYPWIWARGIVDSSGLRG